MRDFILLRGIQGSGKSTFIEEFDVLQPYTISSDSVRLLFQSPEIDPFDNHFKISQKNDKNVWKFIEDRIKEKMHRGELIILDAMNIDVSKWVELSKYYNYNLYVLNFDEPLDICLERNRNREGYKYVPENIIKSCYERIKNSSIPNDVHVFKNKQEFESLFLNGNQPFFGIDNYNKVVFIGDIHGCYQPLNDYFCDNPFSKDNFYIFIGDYLDRGLQNKETLEFLISISEYENVRFIEGNHNWERYYVNNQIERIKSNEFLTNTLPQIQSVDIDKFKKFISKWRLYIDLAYNNQYFFISHAGFGNYPKNKRFISARDYLKGNSYSDDVDLWWEQNNTHNIIQIHGHRNQYEHQIDKFEHSINLCEPVEFGECLRIVEFDKNLNRKFLRYKNNIYKTDKNPWKLDKNKDDIISERLSTFAI